MCANYGTIRVMQSVFMASTKMSFTSKMAGKYTMVPSKKSSYGGSKNLGEMEIMQLDASGMKYVLQEFIDRSDMAVIDIICCSCNHIKMVCDCPNDTTNTAKIMVRASSIQ